MHQKCTEKCIKNAPKNASKNENLKKRVRQRPARGVSPVGGNYRTPTYKTTSLASLLAPTVAAVVIVEFLRHLADLREFSHQ